VTGAVKYKLRELAMRGGRDGGPADVVFVEVGGTAGDYENGFYIEALRELAFEEGPGSACFVALTYIIEPQILGEQKSKAAQLGIKRLMEAGIQPNLIACRAKKPVTETVMEKIGMFSNVPMNRIFSMHDRASVYSIPEEMRKASLDREILSLLNLHDRVDPVHEDESRVRWMDFSHKLVAPRSRSVTLGIPGKYAALRDAYASIDKAVEHAGIHLECDVRTEWIDTTDIENADDAVPSSTGWTRSSSRVASASAGSKARSAAWSTPGPTASPSSGSASVSRSRSSNTPATRWASPTPTRRSSTPAAVIR
jgi:CTP synthase